jgi:hypothetical protein
MSRRSQERCERRPGGEWLASPEIFRCLAGSISGQDINERSQLQFFYVCFSKTQINHGSTEPRTRWVKTWWRMTRFCWTSHWMAGAPGSNPGQATASSIPFFLCRCFRRQNKSWLHRAENQVRRDPAANGSLLPTRIV